MRAACGKPACVVYLTEVLGKWQLEIEAEVEQASELDTIIQSLRRDFPGVIVDFDIVTVTKEHKLNYLPSGKMTRKLISGPSPGRAED